MRDDARPRKSIATHAWRGRAIAFIALGAAVVVAGTWHGPGLSSDSVFFVAGARSLHAGEGFRGFLGAPLSSWPPLYPALLAAVGAAGFGELQAARVINAALLALLSAGGFVFILGATRSMPRALIAGAAALSLPVVYVAVFAWSELLFSAAVLFSIVALDRALESGRRADLLVAATLAAAAGLTRYAAIPVLACGIAMIALERGRGWRRRAADLVLYAAVALGPLVLWTARNYSVARNLTGGRPPANVAPGLQVRRFLAELGRWVFPLGPEGALALQALGVLVVLALGIVAVRSWRRREVTGTSGRRIRLTLRLASFALAYLVFIMFALLGTAIGYVGIRLLQPGYLVTLAALLTGIQPEGGRRTRGPRLVAAAAMLWLGFQLAAGFAAAWTASAGVGFSAPAWRRSTLLAELADWRPRTAVFSNAPPPLYIHLGLPSRMPPEERAADRGAACRWLLGLGDSTVVVWFRCVRYRPIFDLAAPDFDSMLPRVVETPDGWVAGVDARAINEQCRAQAAAPR